MQRTLQTRAPGRGVENRTNSQKWLGEGARGLLDSRRKGLPRVSCTMCNPALHRCSPGCTGARGFRSLGSKDLLHPPLTTFGSLSYFQAGALVCNARDLERKRWPRGKPLSIGPKPHPSKPHPCNMAVMAQAKTEAALQFSESCAAEVALQHALFCSAEVIFTKSCAAAGEKLHCNIENAVLQESGAFLPLSCRFQSPTFRHPR